jgi:hypothetical protein
VRFQNSLRIYTNAKKVRPLASLAIANGSD